MYKVGASPHIRTSETVEKVMYDVLIALLPALIVAFFVFGIRAITVTLVSVIAAMISEAVCQKIMGKDIEIFDGSAIITGILFAFVIPTTVPYVFVAIGAAVSIILGKMLFGGLGHNIFNPALVGRAFLTASWPVAITTWTGYDGTAGATMLDAMKRGLDTVLIGQGNPYMQSLIGNMGGSLGETSALALLIGGIYLIIRKQVDWVVPVVIIATVFVLTAIAGQNPVMHILSGGLFLGAFFMATDMVTSPYSRKGRVIYALGIGILIAVIRLKGGYPEGVAYSILIMNGVTPVINNYTKPKKFGEVKA